MAHAHPYFPRSVAAVYMWWCIDLCTKNGCSFQISNWSRGAKKDDILDVGSPRIANAQRFICDETSCRTTSCSFNHISAIFIENTWVDDIMRTTAYSYQAFNNAEVSSESSSSTWKYFVEHALIDRRACPTHPDLTHSQSHTLPFGNRPLTMALRW